MVCSLGGFEPESQTHSEYFDFLKGRDGLNFWETYGYELFGSVK